MNVISQTPKHTSSGSEASRNLDHIGCIPAAQIDWNLQIGDSGIPLVLFCVGNHLFLRSGTAHATAVAQFELEINRAGLADRPVTLGSGWGTRSGCEVKIWASDPPAGTQREPPFDLEVVRGLIVPLERGLAIVTT